MESNVAPQPAQAHTIQTPGPAASAEFTLAQDPSVRRQFARWPFHADKVPVLYDRPDGPVKSFTVVCKNLSASGLGVVVNESLPMQAAVIVTLPHRYRGAVKLSATVQRCVARPGGLYDVGLLFKKLVNPREYVSLDPLSNEFVSEATDPQRITGRVVVLATSRGVRTRCGRAARTTRAIFHETDLISEACRLARSTDVLVLAVDADEVNTSFAVSAMHSRSPQPILKRAVDAGFSGKLMLILPDRSMRTREMLRDIPFHVAIVEPWDEKLFLRALAEVAIIERFGVKAA